MDPKVKAVQLADQIKNSGLPASEQYGVAVVMAAAGMGVAKHMIVNKTIPPLQGMALLFDLRELVKELEDALKPH